MDGNSGNRPIFGSQSADELHGTDGADHLFGMKGDDILDGGLGADVYNGGAGNDRYVLSDDAVDTLHFKSTNTQQDILDISELVSGDVTSGNLKSYLKVTDKGVYLDSSGQGQFSTENQIARFAANNPPLNAVVAVQVADTSVIQFDRYSNVDSPISGTSDNELATASLNDVSGTTLSDNILGTAQADNLMGLAGDDVLNGGAGADYYDGGEGSDRYVLADSESVETLKFISNNQQQDVIDVSALLPSGVSADNISNYLTVTEDGVYIDADGEGEFSSEDLVAVFAQDNPVFSDEISIQISEDTVVQFDWTQSAGVELTDDNPFLSTEALSQRLDLFDQDGGGKRAFLNSKDGQRFHFKLDEHDLTHALGGEGDELLDASSVLKRSNAQNANEADHAVELFGGKGRDTLRGNDDGTLLDGGEGNDRIEAGKGRNLLIGGSGEDEYALSLESSTDEIKSDMLYDFTSKSGDRDILDLKDVLPEEATVQNIHSYVKVTDEGVFIDTSGKAHFNEESQLARFGERADLDNIVRIKLADGSGIELNRDEAISSIQGESTSDKMKAGEGSDTLYGNAGDDVLDGDALASTKSADFLYGGEGNDKLYIDSLDLSAGAVDGGVGFDTAKIKESSGVSVSLDMHSSGIEKAIGGDSDDVLDGSGFTDTSGGYNKSSGAFDSSEAQRLDLYGRDGNDTLKGGVGRDYLDGGADDDILSGGAGRDFIAGGAGNDTFILADDDEVDTLWDFKSNSDQQDVLDISEFVADDFDYNDLADYFNVDSNYVYFDKTGQGAFTYNQAISKLGGKSEITDPVKVQFDDIQVTFDPSGGDVVLLNTNAPIAIASGQAVDEDSSEGTAVGLVSHTDVDGSNPVTYAISGGNDNGYFTINSSTGAVTLTAAGEAAIDYEASTSHTIQVTASDGTFVSTPVNLTVTLNDVNEVPVLVNVIGNQNIAEDSPLSFQLPENTFSDEDGGSLIYTATMAGGGGLPSWLAFDSGTRTFSGTPDNDNVGTLNLKVTATDPDGLSTQAIFSLDVANVNDAPELTGSPLISGIDAAYSFSDTSDTSGNGNHLTLSGNASLGAGHNDTGQALVMDGTDSSAGASFNMTMGSNLTLSTWVKMDSFDPSWSRVVEVTDGVDSFFIGREKNSSKAVVHIYENGSKVGSLEVDNFFVEGEWVHITSAISDSGDVLLYKNGELAGQSTTSWTPDNVEYNVTLGNRNTGGRGIDGSIDDFAVYDSALSADQIQAVYEADSVENLVSDAFHVVESSVNSTVLGSVAASDVDNASNELIYSLTNDAGGRFTINNSTGEISVADSSQLNHEADDTHTIEVQVSDGALSDTRSYTVYVTDINEAPVAVNETVSTAEDTTYTFSAADFNFSDADQDDALNQVLIESLPGNGSLTLNGVAVSLNDTVSKADIDAGLFKFAPEANANGDDYASFNFNVSDSDSVFSDSHYVMTVDVGVENDVPVVSSNVSKASNEDISFTLTEAELLANTADADNDALAVSNVTVSSGQVSVADNGNGTWTVTPVSNWSGSAQLAFDISDGTATVSSQADLTLTPDADAPTLTVQGSTVLSSMNFNDGLADGWTSENAVETHDSGGPLGASRIGTKVAKLDAETGTPDAYYCSIDTSQGHDHQISLWVKQHESYDGTDEIEIVWNGQVLQTIDPGTSWEEVTINLPDTDQASTQLAVREVAGQNNGVGPLLDQITISRLGADDSTDSSYDKMISSQEDTRIALDLSTSLSDSDGSETLSVSLSGIPAGFAISDGTNSLTTDGSAVDASSWNLANLTITPVANHDTDFTISVMSTATEASNNTTATHTQTIRVDMQPVSDAAVFTGDDSGTLTEDAAATLTTSGSLSVSDADGSASFVAETVNGSHGSLTINAEGNWTYSADNTQNSIQSLDDGEQLTDTITISSNDGTTHTVEITIQGTNDAPLLANAVTDQSVNEDSSFSFTVPESTFSHGDGDILTSSNDGTTHTVEVTIQGTNDAPLLANAVTDQSVNEDSSFSFTVPESTFSHGDGDILTSSNDGTTHTVEVTIQGTNDAPLLANAVTDQSVNEDSSFSFTVPENTFSHGDGDTLTFTATQTDGSALPEWLNFNTSTRVFSGTPDNDDVATLNLKVTATDEDGETIDASFSLIVNNINDAPSPVFAEDNGLVSIEAEHFSSQVNRSGNAWAVENDASASGGQQVSTANNGADGFDTDYTGISSELTYDIQFESAGTYYVWVRGDAPDGNSDSVHIGLNGEAVSTGSQIGFNDGSHDWAGDRINSAGRITIEVDAPGTHQLNLWMREDGTAVDKIVISDDVDYVPSGSGPAESDYVGLSDQTATEEAAFSYTLPANAFSDDDGDSLTFSTSLANGDPLPAWLTFDTGTRTFSGIPDDPDVGSLPVKIMVSDGSETTDVYWSVNVTAVNDGPEPVSDTSTEQASAEGSAITGAASVLANDSDAENDPLTVTDVNGTGVSGSTTITGDYGDLTISEDGNWTYTPATVDLSSGLVAHWTFDETSGTTVNDSTSGTSTDGVLNEGAAFVSAGLNGNAVQFDGASAIVDITDSTELNTYSGSKTERTINFSFKIDTDNDLSGRQVLYEEGGGSKGYNIYIDEGTLYVGAWSNTNGWDNGTFLTQDISAISSDDWQQVSLVLDADNSSLKAYLNGDEFGSGHAEAMGFHGDEAAFGSVSLHYTEGSEEALRGSARFHDGDVNIPDNHFGFDGLIDEARIYDRALNNQELKALGYDYETATLQDVFNYTVSDGTDTSASTLTIDVNRVPEALSGELGGSDAGIIAGQLSAKDLDQGETLVYSLESAPAKGSVTINADGSYTFNPGSDFENLSSVQTEDVTFDFRVTDSKGESSVNTITVTVTGTNVAPELTELPMFDSVVAAFNFSDGSGTLASDSSGEGNNLSLSGSAGFGTGHNGSGTAFEMDGSSGAGEISGLSLGGALSISAWVKFDSFSQSWSRIVDFGDGAANNNIVLAHVGTSNDLAFEIYDGSGSADGVLHISDFFTQGEWVHVTATVDESGAMRVYKNGELAGENLDGAVIPDMVRTNNYVGESHGSNDGSLDGSIDELVVLNEGVDASGARALYQADSVDNLLGDALHIPENTINNTVVGSVTSNDANGDTLTYTLTNDAGGRFSINSSTGEITVADGSLLNFESASSHTITAQVSDGYLSDTRDYTVYITNTNDTPDSADATLNVAEDAVITLLAADFSFSDEDSGDVLSTVLIKTLPGAGVLTLNGVAVTEEQSVSKADINAGLLTFTPVADASGDNYASFTFAVSDGQLESSIQTVTVDVTPVADAPNITVGGSPSYESITETIHDAQLGSLHNGNDGWSNDGGDYGDDRLEFYGGSLSRIIDTSDANDLGYSLTLDTYRNDGKILVYWDNELIVTEDYNHDAFDDWNPTINLPVPAGDSAELRLEFSAPEGFIYINDVVLEKTTQGAPYFETNEDSVLDFSMTASLADTDGSENLTVSLSGIPSGYSLGDGSNSAMSTGADIDVSSWNLSQLQLTPAANSNGNFTMTLSATATETSTGTTSTTTEDLDIRITAVSDAPESEDHTLILKQSDSYTFSTDDFEFTDGDGDSMQSITITSVPVSGSLTLNGSAVTANQVITAADIENLKYTAPATDPVGAVSFGFSVSDGSASSEAYTFNLSVEGAGELIGTSADEILDGTDQADTLKGEGGADTLLGDAGADIIFGGTGDDTIKGDDGQAVAVNLDSAFITAASQISLPSATGLKAEVFDTGTVFSSLDQAVSLVENNNPISTFTASTFNYTRSGNHTLADFIGSDSSTLTGNGDMPGQTFALKMTGYIRLTAGTHDFNVASDDGFRLKINGDTVTEFTAPRGVATSSGNFTAPQDGLYEVELVYWQGNFGADMVVSSSTAEPFQFYDMLPAGAEPVSGQSYYDLPTPDIVVDVASDVALSAGTDNGDGTWTLKGSDLNDLTMTNTGTNAWDDSLTFTSTKVTNRNIAIGDSSFESQNLSDGAWNDNPESSSWTFSHQWNGIKNENSTGMDEQATEGDNIAYINNDNTTISQTLTENFDPNSSYQLQIDIGNRKSESGLANYEVRIKAGGITLASDGSVSPAEGQFETLTLNLEGSSIASDSAAIGQPLTIELIKISGPQIFFDNVRLTATTTEQIGQETVNTDQSDLITGGAGDDVLTGGNDSDTFIWGASDVGTSGTPAQDTIMDFQIGQGGDKIDLSDVLVNESEPLDQYLSLNFDNGDTTIEVKPDADGDVTQKIKLEGVDLSGYGGGSSDTEILNNLIDDGNLQID
ncbi:tandem-95 repeat protein [Endozoicomonas numazuensis]|uniref:Uncharacterized protein n=1 Tax=Endozoicomonas numazuensis TaxID=1137799 RepID=A0A081NH52_9GAMM|nr:tandem-95 repeat protein [Endozoicomonas numazuensis]KEQ17775.1 hypothetical protein GZ78_08895 [Endozoicomonas numazuensis]